MKEKIKSSRLCLQKIIVAVGLILAFIQPVYAINLNSAVGFWQTKDPDTGKISSVVQIYKDKNDDKYSGKIYKIIAEGSHKKTDLCVHCPGEQKNQPMLGLKLIRGMALSSESYYKGGHVLDPRDGKEYHAKMHVVDNGQTLKLRGYIGISWFGKTAVWTRVTPGSSNQ